MIRLEIECEASELPAHVAVLRPLMSASGLASGTYNVVPLNPPTAAAEAPDAPTAVAEAPDAPHLQAPEPDPAPDETPKKGRGRPRKPKTYDVYSFDDDVALGVTPQEAADFLVDRINKQDTQGRIEQLLSTNADTLKALKDTGKAVYQAAQARVEMLKPDESDPSEVPTPEHARAVLLELGNAQGGMTKVLDLLARFGVSSVSQVGDDQRAAFVAEVQRLLEGAA